jgi:hypothetical protein
MMLQSVDKHWLLGVSLAPFFMLPCAWLISQVIAFHGVNYLPWPMSTMLISAVVIAALSCMLLSAGSYLTGKLTSGRKPTTLALVLLRTFVVLFLCLGLLLSFNFCLVSSAYQSIRTGNDQQTLAAFHQLAKYMGLQEAVLGRRPAGTAHWLIATARDFKGSSIEPDLYRMGIEYLRKTDEKQSVGAIRFLAELAVLEQQAGNADKANALFKESDELLAKHLSTTEKENKVLTSIHAEQVFKSHGGNHNTERPMWDRYYHSEIGWGPNKTPAYYALPIAEYHRVFGDEK